jgi:molybdopterin synthase catalytic subunit
MEDSIFIHIGKEVMNLQACYDFVQDESCGGIAVFVGTVRDNTNKRSVKKLEFSAYEPMAIKEMRKIALDAIERFGIHKIAIHHAIGELKIGAVPVIIAVSSTHRAAAFEACQFAIDTLKKTVPIWKKEYFEDGEVWVNAHP